MTAATSARQRRRKLKPFLTILTASLLLVTGCAGLKPHSTFNPNAILKVPPEGCWLADSLAYGGKGEWYRTGKIWLPPGVEIVAGE